MDFCINQENNNVEKNDIEEINESLVIVKNKKDIISEIDFDTEDDMLLCDAIIDNLEKDISDGVKNNKCVQIPFIGCIRVNPVKREFSKYKKNFSVIRNSVTKEQYQNYVKNYIVDIRKKQSEKDKLRLIFYKLKRHNKKKYNYYYQRFGRNYAELFILSIYWLKEIPFDAEWEIKYQELKKEHDL